MKLFTISNNVKLVSYKEQVFSDGNYESDLEILLEKNPEYFFDNSKICIIGRQVSTNLGTWIDLLGLDKSGNSVAIELKRGKTPRETIAQILEYASYVENLDYNQLNNIFQVYIGEESSLDLYHQEYFGLLASDTVSFNKSTKLVIVAQEISPSIKQTAQYLRKKGLDIYCLEFKYFMNHASEKLISSDYVVGDDTFIQDDFKPTSQLPKTDLEKFLNSLDRHGQPIFEKLFEFAKESNLFFGWGSKGFSLNYSDNDRFVGLCFGYPPESVFKQSIYSGFEEINKKINEPEIITTYFRSELEKMEVFVQAKKNLKWVINKHFEAEYIEKFINVIQNVIEKVKLNGFLE